MIDIDLYETCTALGQFAHLELVGAHAASPQLGDLQRESCPVPIPFVAQVPAYRTSSYTLSINLAAMS